MKNGDDKKKKNFHPLDSWPPPQEQKEEEKKPSEKLPRNVSYKAMHKEPDPFTDESSDMAVYEIESQEEQEREQEKEEEFKQVSHYDNKQGNKPKKN